MRTEPKFIQRAWDEPECESYPPHRTDNPTRVLLMVALAAILTALFT